MGAVLPLPPAITLGNGNVKKDKGFVIDISVNEYTADLPDEFGLKLLSGGEMTKLFESEMQFHFTPYDVKIAESGINAVVEKVLDYGTEKFAVCKVGGVTVNVSAENVAEGDSVCLAPDYNKLSVYDTSAKFCLFNISV